MFPALYWRQKPHGTTLFCRVLWLSQRLLLGRVGFSCWGWQDDLMGRKQVTVTIKTGRFFFWFEAKGMKLLKVVEFFVWSIFFVSGGHKDEDNLFCVDKKILSNEIWKVVHFWHSSLRWRLFFQPFQVSYRKFRNQWGVCWGRSAHWGCQLRSRSGRRVGVAQNGEGSLVRKADPQEVYRWRLFFGSHAQTYVAGVQARVAFLLNGLPHSDAEGSDERILNL